MPDAKSQASLLFLRETQLRLAQDMLFFAARDLAACTNPVLAQAGLGRAHHRALHFIGRNPGLTVSDLLAILGVTKQSLARVLTALLAQGLVTQEAGRSDRRQRLLRLTEAGAALERTLFDRQRERLLAAFRAAGGPEVEGFRKVLRGIMGPGARHMLDAREAADSAPRMI